MNYIGQIVEAIQRFLIWWLQVMPWQSAVHVRLGKYQKILKPGIHLRLPIVDRVYVQDVRRRVLQCPPQTLTTRDGVTMTIVMNLGYQVTDIRKLYDTMYHTEQSLAGLIMALVAQVVVEEDANTLRPDDIETHCIEGLKNEDIGLEFSDIRVIGFCRAKAIRLIQENHWLPDQLLTNDPKS